MPLKLILKLFLLQVVSTLTNSLSLLPGGIPRFSIAAAAAGMAQYLSQSQGGPLKTHAGHIVERTHLYWPGLQGLVANPIAWRERLSNTSKFISINNP